MDRYGGKGLSISAQPPGSTLKLVAKSRGADSVIESMAVYSEPNTIARALVEAYAGCNSSGSKRWLGSGPIERAQVAQWLSLRGTGLDPNALQTLNEHLLCNSFLVSHSPSLADVAVFWAVQPKLAALGVAEAKASLLGVCRWFDQLQNSAPVCASPLAPPHLEFTGIAVDRAATKAAVKGAAQTKAPGGGSESAQKKSKKEKKKKEKKKKKAAPPAAPSGPEVAKLDLRVGEIKRAWKHEEADSLYCEEIDLGEESGPRQIASGLVKAYNSSDEVLAAGKRVVVLCNLKPRNMVGFPSHGMVLCAASKSEGDAKPKVELLAAPANAKVGERLSFAGVEPVDAATPAQMAKKKIFDKVAPFLVTDAQGVACWLDDGGGSHAFTTSAGVVQAPNVKGGTVA